MERLIEDNEQNLTETATIVAIGGGLKMGQVIGQSARDAGEPATTPVTIKNLVATILHTLVDVGEVRVVRGMPRDVVQMTEWDPIPGIV